MTPDDPLEIELAALRPREPSVELRQRIALRLDATTLRHGNERESFWRTSALAGGLLAASLAAVLTWQSGDSMSEPQPAATLNINFASAFDPTLPSLWSYRRALAQDPESLNGLLDRHASQTLQLHCSAPAFVFARSSIDVDALTGEL